MLGVLKLGVIFLQLHTPQVRGATADLRYAGFGTLAAWLLEFGQEVRVGRVF